MRIFLLRHGQSAANASGVFYGSTDLSLTPQGMEQSQRVAGYLAEIAFGQVIVSGLQRARQTARLIAPAGEFHVDSRLNELDFGTWEMRHCSEIAQASPLAWQRWVDDWQNAAPDGGESFPQFAARVAKAASDIGKRQESADTLIVAHQGTLSLLLANWLGLPVDAMWRFRFMHDAWTMVENRAGFKVLRVFNARSVCRADE